MDYSRYDCLSAQRDGKVLTVSFNRPQALNAINAQLHTELSQIFADIAQTCLLYTSPSPRDS